MKDRILETADKLFYLQGIRAVGVDTIAAEIGISKRTLYNHFPSKDALISAYLARRFVAPRPSDKSPVEQILGTFDSLERRFSAKDFRGCPFVNAVAELAAKTARSGRSPSRSRKAAALWFRDLLVQIGVPDAEALATQLALLVDGSIAQDLVRNDPAMARAAKEAATVLLGNAGVKVGGEQNALETPRPGPISRPCAVTHTALCYRGAMVDAFPNGATAYGSLRSQGRRRTCEREGNEMEDLKVTANGYDFKPAHAAMQRYVDNNLLSGISWAVMVGRDLVDVNCVGWADKEAQTPLRTDHIFRVFSNTKLVTSCAALLLFEEGKFGLDDPIEKYIPQLGNRKVLRPGATSLDDTEPAKSSITIRQLLSHSSGPELRLLRSRHGDLQGAQRARRARSPDDAGRHGRRAGRPAADLSARHVLGIFARHRRGGAAGRSHQRPDVSTSSSRRAFSIRSAWSTPASSFRRKIRTGWSPITPART